MRLAFTGGGTGGHVFPNIAIVEELRKMKPSSEIFYIGEKNGMEEKICHAAGVPFYGIYAGKLRRYFDIKNFIDFFKVPVGFGQALVILRRLRPDLLFAKGGYVSVPVVLAARLLGIPVWIHESDATPGLATKICSRFAERIFCAFPEGAALDSKSPEIVGNPIRKEILNGAPAEGYRLTGSSKTKPVILVMGGSIGAESLNKMIFGILPALMKKAQILHITGNGHPELVSGSITGNYKTFDFLEVEPLAHIYAISDLVISRAGSGSIFELLALKKPMLLVPLPRSASRGDQIENAEIFGKHGWARVVYQEHTSSKEFLAQILELLKNENARKKMIEQQKKAHFEDAAERIAKAMLENRLL